MERESKKWFQHRVGFGLFLQHHLCTLLPHVGFRLQFYAGYPGSHCEQSPVGSSTVNRASVSGLVCRHSSPHQFSSRITMLGLREGTWWSSREREMRECQEWCFWREGRSALALQAPTGQYRKGFREREEKGPLGKKSLSYPGPSLRSGLCWLVVMESTSVPGVGSGVQHVTGDTLPEIQVGGRPRDKHQLRKRINQVSVWCECWLDHKPRNELQSVANGAAQGARGVSVDLEGLPEGAVGPGRGRGQLGFSEDQEEGSKMVLRGRRDDMRTQSLVGPLLWLRVWWSLLGNGVTGPDCIWKKGSPWLLRGAWTQGGHQPGSSLGS